MTLRCLIVDDEPLAQQVIAQYLQDVPVLTHAGTCASALEAMEALHDRHIDLMFLDINMPRLSGLAMLRTLRHPPLVIITTAYQEYALDGYALDVVDYLMKPFSFERFLQAVGKAQARIHRRPPSAPPAAGRPEAGPDLLFLKVDGQTVRVDLSDLYYVEAMGDYVKVHAGRELYVAHQSLKDLEAFLPAHRFPRIHKSYLVAMAHVAAIEGNRVHIRGTTLPIGKHFRPAFMAHVDALSS